MLNDESNNIYVPMFGKQFLIHKNFPLPQGFDHWERSQLRNGYLLDRHPDLTKTEASGLGIDLVLLGDIFDPRIPEATNVDILRNLLIDLDGFDDLELKLSRLGGRWVLVITLNGVTRLYHDASGLKMVFYLLIEKNLYIASQPALLKAMGLAKDDPVVGCIFNNYKFPPAEWPINLVPFENVKQLLPNHWLNIDNSKVTRYWPQVQLQERTLDEAAELMSELLTGMMVAMVNRRACVISLSAGYDSRMLTACAKPYWDKLKFITVKAAHTPHHDLSVPKKIARKCSLDHACFYVDEDPSVIRKLSDNVGNMYKDFSLSALKTACLAVGDKLNLQGTVIVGTKVFYYKNGKHPENITAQMLSQITRFGENPKVVSALGEWLGKVPDGLNIKVLDLALWEQSGGIFTACGTTIREAMIDLIPPTNCREFLETGLSTDVKYRIKPYPLIRRIIELNAPELLQIPFNHDWVATWQQSFFGKTPFIPWRVKRVLKLV